MKLSTIMLAVLATVVTHSAMASTYYRWVDKNGSTHYTKTPPPKGGKLVGKTETYVVPNYYNPTNTVQSNAYTPPSSAKDETASTSTSAPRNLAMPVSQNSNYSTSPVVTTPVQKTYTPLSSNSSGSMVEMNNSFE